MGSDVGSCCAQAGQQSHLKGNQVHPCKAVGRDGIQQGVAGSDQLQPISNHPSIILKSTKYAGSPVEPIFHQTSRLRWVTTWGGGGEE